MESDMLMTIKTFYFLCRWLDKLAGIKDTDEQVEAIKQQAVDKVDQTTASLKRVGELQQQVMKRTTTYYLGKAMGGIK